MPVPCQSVLPTLLKLRQFHQFPLKCLIQSYSVQQSFPKYSEWLLYFLQKLLPASPFLPVSKISLSTCIPHLPQNLAPFSSFIPQFLQYITFSISFVFLFYISCHFMYIYIFHNYIKNIKYPHPIISIPNHIHICYYLVND